MKKFWLLFTILVTMITMPAFQCGERPLPELPVSLVCNASRTDYKTINDESGVIVQSTQGSFAIRIAEKNPARSIFVDSVRT